VGFSISPLFFAYSRGAYVAALLVVTAYGLLKKPTLLVLVAALLITWQTVLPPTVVERISMTQTETGEIEASAAHRVVLWEHAKQLFEDNITFGIGFNGFGFTVPAGELTDTHSFYMKTASEQGVIGLTIFALVLLIALHSGWRLYRRGQSPFHQGLGLGFIGCTLAVITSNLFGDRWSYFALGSYFWIFWGLVDRAFQLDQEPQPSAQAEPAELQRSVTIS
jgi:O-antigen ligase